MAKKSCKKGYYYCYASKKCKRIPMGYYVGGGGWLRKEEEKSEDTNTETKKNGNGNGANGNGNGNGGSNGGSNGGGVSEAWSAKYKKSIDCDNPKGFSQRAHCRGRKKVNEATMSPAQKRKDTMLKKKYDKSDMKQNMIDQYGKEEGTKIYFATIRKQAMKTEAKEHEDHEVSMAQSQLKKSERNIKKLRKALGTKEKNIPAWVQAKITDTEHNTDAAAGYMEEGKRDGKSAKSKGYSLRDWFKGGGWVQAGGKYDGKPCAKQPGQKTKPYCRDADDRASMSKEERNKRAAKKRKEDPNPNRTGKARNVTQESYSNWRADLEQLDEFLAGKPGDGYIGHPNLDIKNPLAKKQVKKEVLPGSRGGGAVNRVGAAIGDRNMRLNRMLNQSQELKGELVDEAKIGFSNPAIKGRPVPYPKGHPEEGKPMEFNKAETEGKNRYDRYNRKHGTKIRADQPLPEEKIVEGKKDACYHKVKSRYSVWPSAYASGALVKCRKVGAKNWGNKTKKEEFSNWRNDLEEMASEKKIDKKLQKPVDTKKFNPSKYVNDTKLMPGHGIEKKIQDDYQYSNWRDDFQATEYETVDIIKPEPLQPSQSVIDEGGKKCWKGYKKAGTQKLFGKTYNRCVKAHFSDWRADMDLQEKKAKKDYDGDGKIESGKDEYMGSRDKAIKKAIAMKEDWQKSNRKDGVDGMSQKSVDAYKRENPGSKLKTAVTGKVKKGSKDAKRRKSFCSRSNGQRKMHNIDCSKTPEKKICKARKRWRC